MSFKNDAIYYLFKVLYFLGKKQYLHKIWWFFYYFDFWRRKIVFKNLDIAFPKKDKKEKIKIAKNLYKNFLKFFEDAILFDKNPNLLNIEIKNKVFLEEVLKLNEPAIFVTAHFGNWEILPKYISYQDKRPIAIVMRKIDHPKIDEFFKKIRGDNNIKILKKDDIRGIVRALKKEKRLVGILIDQYISNKKEPEITFFKKTKFNSSVSRLSKSLDTIVLPVFIYLEKDKYIVEFKEPKRFENTTIEDFTKWQANTIEDMIKKYPDQYYWFHNRWKD